VTKDGVGEDAVAGPGCSSRKQGENAAPRLIDPALRHNGQHVGREGSGRSTIPREPKVIREQAKQLAAAKLIDGALDLLRLIR
jgi:hypothetical protein